MKKFFCPPCLLGLILILAVLGGYYLLKGGYQQPALEEKTTPPKEVITEEETTPPSVTEIIVSGTEYRFNPASVTVKKGERVKITFRNDGSIGHNFTIADLGVSTKTISAGQTDTVEFTAPASGTYTFFCSIPGHRAAGMEGSLEVE